MAGLLPDLSQLVPALQSAGQATAPQIADAVRQYVPVAKNAEGSTRAPGTAAASLVGASEPTSAGVRLTVTSDDPVVRYLLEGTPQHLIPLSPKPPGTALHFIGADGSDVFRRQVLHPGTPITRFDLAAQPEIQQIVDGAVNTALAQVWGS